MSILGGSRVVGLFKGRFLVHYLPRTKCVANNAPKQYILNGKCPIPTLLYPVHEIHERKIGWEIAPRVKKYGIFQTNIADLKH